MKFTTLLFLFIFHVVPIGCTNKKNKQDYILTERDLIPEGTAFDTKTGTIYIGSTFKRKIIQITSDGKVTDFIPEKSNGVFSLVGMEVDEERGILWANTAHANQFMPLIDPHPTKDWMTTVSAYDIQQKKLIKRYELNADTAFLNDLTVLPDGDVFATESVNNKIYKIDSHTDSLELFLEPAGFTFLNGITYSEKLNSLFVSSVQGILNINIDTKTYSLLKTRDSIDAQGIDGLTLYKDQLVGHQSSKVFRFYLNENATEIVKAEILDSGDEFDSSTTGEIGGDYYYFIVNSQVRSGIDRTNRTIKPLDSLENVIIRKIKL